MVGPHVHLHILTSYLFPINKLLLSLLWNNSISYVSCDLIKHLTSTTKLSIEVFILGASYSVHEMKCKSDTIKHTTYLDIKIATDLHVLAKQCNCRL